MRALLNLKDTLFSDKKRRGIDLPRKQWRRHSLKTVSGGQAVGRWKKQPFYVPFSNLYSGERNRYKDFSAGLLVENTSFCVLRLENSQRDTVYSREETISSEGFFQSKVEVCVVEEETNYGQQLNGVTLNDGIYEVETASVRAEELVGLAESYSPDVLILLEQSKEELDETIQKEIDLWQAEGGLLITFQETRHLRKASAVRLKKRR